jgi:hypothetical protein
VVTALCLLALLLAGHAIADSILQPPWLSIRKRDPNPAVRATALAIHGAIHALPVALVTAQPVLALLELVLHPLIDDMKRRGWYGLKTDQALHVACKLAWIALLPALRDVPWPA